MKEELDIRSVKIATKVIIHAGNCRALVNDSIKAAGNGDLEGAKTKLEQAKLEIESAHSTQTEVIQAEARGEDIPLSLLLTHAQDSLMVALSEVFFAQHILGLHQRLNKLEADLAKK